MMMDAQRLVRRYLSDTKNPGTSSNYMNFTQKRRPSQEAARLFFLPRDAIYSIKNKNACKNEI